MSGFERCLRRIAYLFNVTIPFCRTPFIDYGVHDSVAICSRRRGHSGWHSRTPFDDDLKPDLTPASISCSDATAVEAARKGKDERIL